MTPDPAADPINIAKEAPSTAGMTTKVVKGSLWTLAGQVVLLLATLVSTPFVIRFLGSESYGVLILIGLIPAYFTFADFGMGIASTKFGSAAYGRGDRSGEGAVVRSAGVIALISSTVVAVPIFFFAGYIINALNVPDHLHWEAATALQLTSVSFVLSILSGVLNTPQLARLRMDLNAAINSVGRVLLAFGTVLVLYLGWGLVGAAAAGLLIAIAVLIGHVLVSGRLLRTLYETSLELGLFRHLIKFGGGLLVSGIAAILLINLEKLLLARMVSVQALAYYSIAFTFANMATMFSWGMVQSLIPAFSQLQAPEKRQEFEALFARGIRITILWVLPTFTFLFIIARPFFTVWAGEDFGRESSTPFYVLLIGLFFNLVAYIPHSAITAFGRTDVFAKVYWIELVPSIVLTMCLVNFFGIIGAAMAWSIRVAVDAFIFLWLSKRIVGVQVNFKGQVSVVAIGILILIPPALIAGLYDNYSILLLFLLPIFGGFYAIWMWMRFLEETERNWISQKWLHLLKF